MVKKAVVLFMAVILVMVGCSSGVATQDSEVVVTDEVGELETVEEITEAGREEEDWSERYDRLIAAVYGDDFDMAYSMEDIVGTTDDDNFLCDYKKLALTLENNCVLLAQETGDGTERTIEYDIEVLSGECAIMYDNDEGVSTIIWSGRGHAQGTTAITLGTGTGCLRLTALDGKAKLKISLQCLE